MSISFPKEGDSTTLINNNKRMDYKICFVSTHSFSMTATQDDVFLLLEEDSEKYISKQTTFLLRPSGDFLFDLFVCSGDANVTYASSMNGLKLQKSNPLDRLGMPDQLHAVKMNMDGTTFVNVSATSALVRWLPINI